MRSARLRQHIRSTQPTDGFWIFLYPIDQPCLFKGGWGDFDHFRSFLDLFVHDSFLRGLKELNLDF